MQPVSRMLEFGRYYGKGVRITSSPMQSASLHEGFMAGQFCCSFPCSWDLLLDSGADLCLSGTVIDNLGTISEITDGRGAL